MEGTPGRGAPIGVTGWGGRGSQLLSFRLENRGMWEPEKGVHNVDSRTKSSKGFL